MKASDLPRQQFIEESVPSLALRSGDLSVYGLGQVPQSQISPVALAVLKYLFPLPNTGGPNAIVNNYQTNFPTPISSNQGDVRLDQVINSKQTVFVRGTYKNKDATNEPSAGGPNPPFTAGESWRADSSTPEVDYAVTAAYNYLITPAVVNELRLGVTADRTITSDSANAQLLASEIGIPLPQVPVGNVTPCFVITGFQSTCSTAGTLYRSQTKQLIDNLTWTKGSHTYKFGGDIRRLKAYFSNPAGPLGRAS